MNDTLSGLLSELQRLRKTVDSQHAGICSLNRNVSKLLKENRDLRRRLSKYGKPPGNSGNGSTPPSKESVRDEAVLSALRSLYKTKHPRHSGESRNLLRREIAGQAHNDDEPDRFAKRTLFD